MIACLCVGIGGGIGAVLRYLAGIALYHETFPAATFCVNAAGAVLIGMVIGVSEQTNAPENLILFLKTGVCGGFTTFSTFSSEVLELLEKKHCLLAAGHSFGSVILCILGVWLGKWISHMILK